jgi:hypothetical protein
VAYPGILLRRGRGGGGVQQMKLRTEGRGNGIIIRLLRMYFPRNWEFGSALSKLLNFGGGEGVFEPPNPPRYATEYSET